MDAGATWAVWLLVASSVLNALYFLPILYSAWFEAPPDSWPAERIFPRAETSLVLLLPTLFTAAVALAVGLFASAPFSPLEWARLVATRQYGP
jgi:multicomponent Na+:H+ antiporter subunit D